MKHYKVIVQSDARADFRRCVNYLLYNKRSRQAADSLIQDFDKTLKTLSNIAGSLRDPDSEVLKTRNLKRLNFRSHDYFLLFCIEEDIVIVTNIFHGYEDFENKIN
ncbi:MAG: type II toxin-antitoxin system RelE/ParE family toxin [Flexilinea sp.]|nr:type II toxin-antitoxin system RelE/ParE family toxin [Flexilinea sp.]